MKPAAGGLFALGIAALLAACAPAEIRPTFETVEFELAGRLAARYQSESFTGNVTWKHSGAADEMLISTPLGQGVARVARQGDAVTLATAEPRTYHAADAEVLTERVLGFRVPLEGLADWVRGRASPSSPASIERQPDGRLKALRQRGWTIEYLEYEGERPSRMRLTYPGIDLRLAITQWN